MRERVTLTLLLVIDLAGVAVLHSLGERPWTTLSADAPAEDAVVALLRLAAIGLGGWVVVSTTLYWASRLAGAIRPARALERLVLPGVRRLVGASLAASLTVGPVAPAIAEQSIPPVVLLDRQHEEEDREEDGPEEHVVRPGEHLWAIAAATVGSDHPERIAHYWRRLVQHNRERIRSGDPDLIHPGELIELPSRGPD